MVYNNDTGKTIKWVIPLPLGRKKFRRHRTVPCLRAAKEAGLPTEGKIRYVPPKNAGKTLPRTPDGGYIDRFDNVWIKGKTRTIGEPFEWDVQLSRTGRQQLGWLSRDGRHINVSLKGRITHR